MRFYDDGDVYDHFDGLGIRMENDGQKQFLSVIAESYGLARTEAWEVELEVAPDQAAAAFAQYMGAMSAFVEWEKARDDAVEVLHRPQLGQTA